MFKLMVKKIITFKVSKIIPFWTSVNAALNCEDPGNRLVKAHLFMKVYVLVPASSSAIVFCKSLSCVNCITSCLGNQSQSLSRWKYSEI